MTVVSTPQIITNPDGTLALVMNTETTIGKDVEHHTSAPETLAQLQEKKTGFQNQMAILQQQIAAIDPLIALFPATTAKSS